MDRICTIVCNEGVATKFCESSYEKLHKVVQSEHGKFRKNKSGDQ